MPRPRTDTIRFLTLDELGRLLAATRGSVRDRALFLLAYRHGLRASEVGLLRVEDLDLRTLRLMVHRLKGSHSGAHPLQPGGSVKDRAARAILLAARADGRLRPGAPVVEMTSGNMGAGLAVACAVLGHSLVVTMSAGNSPQRAHMLEALGAEVVLVPQVDGAPGQVTGADVAAAAEVAQRLAAERGGFYVDQFSALEGPGAHEATTGPEIWDQASGRVDAWVACVGTGATFLGVAAALRRATHLSPAPQWNRPDASH